MLSSRCHCCIRQTLSLLSAAILLVVSHVALLLVLVIHLVTPHSQDSKEAFSSRRCQIRTHRAGSVHAPPRVSCWWKTFPCWSILILVRCTSWCISLLSQYMTERLNYSLGLLFFFVAGRANQTWILGLFFIVFIFLGVYSSPPQFKHFISSCHQKMFHPSIHATNIFTLPTSDIWFNSNFSQGFFINWNRQFWFFHHSFVYSRFFFPTVAPTLEKNREMTKHDIQVTVAPSNTSEFFFFYFLRVVVYAGSKTIFCVVCKVSD